MPAVSSTAHADRRVVRKVCVLPRAWRNPVLESVHEYLSLSLHLPFTSPSHTLISPFISFTLSIAHHAFFFNFIVSDSGQQTAAHEPHEALWPLECGSSTKYYILGRVYFEEVALEEV